MEKQLFFRFLKEKGAYKEFINELQIVLRNRGRGIQENEYTFRVLDRFLGWGSTRKGFKYWYYLQIDLIILCLENNPTTEIADYCCRLLLTYDSSNSHKCSSYYDRLEMCYRTLCGLGDDYSDYKKRMRNILRSYFSEKYIDENLVF